MQGLQTVGILFALVVVAFVIAYFLGVREAAVLGLAMTAGYLAGRRARGAEQLGVRAVNAAARIPPQVQEFRRLADQASQARRDAERQAQASA